MVSEAAVKQELLNTGVDPKVAIDQEKVLARLAIIMRRTTAAQSDAARTADSFGNQMKRLKAAIEDTSKDVGTLLLPIITPLVQKVGDFVQGPMARWIQQHQQLIPKILKLAAGVAAGVAALVVLGKGLTGDV